MEGGAADEMHHFMYDAYRSYRSRLDDVHLVHEVLEEIPQKLGLGTVMPPFVLPYYNGVVPDDCGISSFVFLPGGHFTLHTFSFREAFFADLVSPAPFDAGALADMIGEVFPAGKTSSALVERGRRGAWPGAIGIDEKNDFGPHLLMDFASFGGPATLDGLFDLFDALPDRIGMTPIMRPYAIRGSRGGRPVLSVMTMIAESHVSAHVSPDRGEAYFDLFSCSFFDAARVTRELAGLLGGPPAAEHLVARGSGYKLFRNETEAQTTRSRAWVRSSRG